MLRYTWVKKTGKRTVDVGGVWVDSYEVILDGGESSAKFVDAKIGSEVFVLAKKEYIEELGIIVWID